VDSSRETKLVQMDAGLETNLATGTEYEMGQKAEELAQLWETNLGFKRQPADKPAGEPLEWTVALAKRMGFTFLYDDRYKTLELPRLNVTGAVPLDEWPGMTPQGGGSYEYALGRLQIHARPVLPLNHPLNMPARSGEFAAYALNYSKALAAVGPIRDFTLGGQD
jgi:hypothetical protein